MTKPNFNKVFKALPAYAGGKRSLNPWIFCHLAEIVPASTWRGMAFVDPFVGGGSVSMFAKAQGFGGLMCNDWSIRSQFIIQGLIANACNTLTDADMLQLFQPLIFQEPSFVERELGGHVFSMRHSQILDTLRRNINLFKCPTKRSLATLVLWHLVHQFVAFGTSVGSSNRPFAEVLDGTGNWWELNPKRLQDGSMEHLIQPVWPTAQRIQKRINKGVFAPAGWVYSAKQDAMDFVSSVEGQVLYLDPPYPGTAGYEKENYILDAVLQGSFPPHNRIVSPYTQGTEALSELLTQSKHIPVWVLSYGNKVTDLDALIKLVRDAREGHEVVGWAKQHTHMPHVSKNENNQELLVISIDRKFQQSLEKRGV